MRRLRCKASDQDNRPCFVRLPHDYRGSRRDFIRVTNYGDTQRTPEHIRTAAQIERRGKPGTTDRHAHGADAPGAAEAVTNHDGWCAACQCAQAIAQPRRARIRILG